MDRKTQLARLLPGDIFHGSCSSSDVSLICLVEEVSEDRIVARRITTQDRLSFDRITGREIGDRAACAIDSTAPLPVPIYNTLLGLERKMRLQSDREKFKLDRDEREALMFVGPYYRSNRLPT
jgi:hypothetical protein